MIEKKTAVKKPSVAKPAKTVAVAKKPLVKPKTAAKKSVSKTEAVVAKKSAVSSPLSKGTVLKYFQAIGKRKNAAALVRLWPNGKGKLTVNNKTPDQYFNTAASKIMALSALKLVGMETTVDVSAKLFGGGKIGQAAALRHGLSRALVKYNQDLRPALRAKGFLTRDPRVKERKKPGLKKARRAPQWSKR